MADDSLRGRAELTARRAGILDEQGVVVQEGFGSSRAAALESTLGDVIPGFSSLLRSGLPPAQTTL
jgi:hypothetical protein